MLRHLFLLGLFSLLSVVGAGKTSASGPVHVSGYTKANGTYVAPYYRSAPGTAGGSTGSVSLISTATATSLSSVAAVPAPIEPSGTYAGWSSISPAWADTILGSGFRNGAMLTYGYSHRQSVPTMAALRTLLTWILKDEGAGDTALFTRQEERSVLVLVFRADEPRGLLVRIDPAGAGRTVQVLGFAYDSGSLNIDGYADSRTDLLLAALGNPASPAMAPPPTSSAVSIPVSSAGQLTNPVAAPAGLVLDSNIMFMDPESGNIIVAATCAPFKVTFRPTGPFSRVALKVTSNSPVDYSLNVLAGERLRYTQVDYTRSSSDSQELLVGPQPTGTPVTLNFTNRYSSTDCQATLVLSVGAR